jgi:hypothetical protein
LFSFYPSPFSHPGEFTINILTATYWVLMFLKLDPEAQEFVAFP